MKTKTWLHAISGIAALLLASCAPAAEPEPVPQLRFEAPVAISAGQEFHVSLGLHNADARDFAGDERFEGQMEIRDASGELRASAEVLDLPAIPTGDTAWPLEWRGELAPGSYRLTWGSDKHGFTTVEFTVVERNGRLYMAEDAPPEESTESERLTAQAIADLAGRLGINADQIIVESVTPAEFPDASLGVPEPGMTYAQADRNPADVVTPGYAIRLMVDGQGYEYHAAGDRVVLASGDAGVTGTVTVEGVQVTPDAIVVEGRSTFPDGTSIQTELLAGDQAAIWWPESAYAVVQDGEWQITVPLDGATLDRETAYIVYAWAQADKAPSEWRHPAGNSTRVAFPFDLAGPPAPANDWPVISDETYGFQLAYPEDWMYKDLSPQGAGMPDDWPVERVVIFYPQAWADRFEHSGPPDPDAPPAIPALSLEVCVGSEEQFRRAYVEPDRSETLTINGLEAIREETGTGNYVTVQYVFQDPANPDVRVVLIDNFSKFVDRAAEHPEIVELIPTIVTTFEFAR